MESRGFAFIPIAKDSKAPICQSSLARCLRSSGANPFLKSYTTILQWFVDGYNTIHKNFTLTHHSIFIKVYCYEMKYKALIINTIKIFNFWK